MFNHEDRKVNMDYAMSWKLDSHIGITDQLDYSSVIRAEKNFQLNYPDVYMLIT